MVKSSCSKWRPAQRALIAACLAMGVSLSTAQSNSTTYTFTLLETLGGKGSSPSGINNRGQVVGFAQASDGKAHAVVWNGPKPTDLGTVGGTASFGHAINDSGQVAGDAYYIPGSTNSIHPVRWTGTESVVLGPKVGAFGGATGINDKGQVVGVLQKEPNGIGHAIIWTGTQMNDIGAGITTGPTQGFGINDAGLVVGVVDEFSDSGSDEHAVLWNGTSVVRLNGLGGPGSTAVAVNNSGTIVGWADTAEKLQAGTRFESYATHAALWKGPVVTDLGTLGGKFGQARAINSSGQIVGRSSKADDDVHATLWNGSTIVDLNTLLPPDALADGWVLVDASGINDNGWITGDATNSKVPQPSRSYVLSISHASPH